MPEIAESNTSEQLKALVRLQHIDSRIDQIEKLRGDLPDEIRDLEDEKAGLTTRIQKLKQEQKDAVDTQKRNVRDISDSEALIKKYEEQQLQVRNNREYDALTKEIEAQRQRITDLQTQIPEMENRAGLDGVAIVEAETRLKDLDEILEGKRKELQAVFEDTKHEESDLMQKREEAEQAVDPRYARAYNRLRTRMRDGRAVVPLERGAACGFSVPPQRQVEIRQRNRIVVCEHTGRIIVDDELYREALEEIIAAH